MKSTQSTCGRSSSRGDPNESQEEKGRGGEELRKQTPKTTTITTNENTQREPQIEINSLSSFTPQGSIASALQNDVDSHVSQARKSESNTVTGDQLSIEQGEKLSKRKGGFLSSVPSSTGTGGSGSYSRRRNQSPVSLLGPKAPTPNGSMQASKAIIAAAAAAAAAAARNTTVGLAVLGPEATSPVRVATPRTAPPVSSSIASRSNAIQVEGMKATESQVASRGISSSNRHTAPKIGIPETLAKSMTTGNMVPKSTAKASLPIASTGSTTVTKKRKSSGGTSGASGSSGSNNKRQTTSQPGTQSGKHSTFTSGNNSNKYSSPMVDPIVVKLVKDIVTLLQSYGPLTYGQLEFNLPPLAKKHLLTDVLQLLVATSVVKKLKPLLPDGSSASKSNSSKSEKNRSASISSPPVLYCMFGGVPRTDDVLMPQMIWEHIDRAQQEAKRSLERCERLRKILLDTTIHKRFPKEGLTALLEDYPNDIRSDSVYLAALRNLNVDLNSTGGNGHKSKATSKSVWITSSASAPGATSDAPKAPASTACVNNSSSSTKGSEISSQTNPRT